MHPTYRFTPPTVSARQALTTPGPLGGTAAAMDATFPRLALDGYTSSGVRAAGADLIVHIRSPFGDPRAQILQENANELQAYIDLQNTSAVVDCAGRFCERLRLYGSGLESDSQQHCFQIFLHAVTFLNEQNAQEELSENYGVWMSHLESFLWVMIRRVLDDEQYNHCIQSIKFACRYLEQYDGVESEFRFRNRLCVLLDADGLTQAVQSLLGSQADDNFFEYSYCAHQVAQVLSGKRKISFNTVAQFVSDWSAVLLAMKASNNFLAAVGHTQITHTSMRTVFNREFLKLTPEQKAEIEIRLSNSHFFNP